ncbi:MAG: PEGA domain-containing protein [Myxococcales bacterium]|nr:PEGA domain-containing protein [Myxococcales bacterium]
MRCALVLVALLAGSAHAEDRAAAERYFRAGAKAYAAQSFAAAAQNFDEAYRQAAIPEIAFSAAQAYRRLYRIDPKPEHVKRAVELYRAYLKEVKTGKRVGDAADNLAEMERELDKLALSGTTSGTQTAPPARTRIGVSVTFADQRATEELREIADATGEAATKGLTAKLDGKPIEPFALVEVDAKEHLITVNADGYFPVEKKTIAVDGQSSLIEIQLQPRPAAVTVKTEDGARIVVDGRPVAASASGTVEVPAGKHLIAVLRRGREPFAREIEVTRGDALRFDAPLVKTARRRAVPWVLGGAGVLAGLAVTTGILAAVHDGNAADLRAQLDAGNRPPSDGDAYDAEVRSRDRYGTATWVLGGAAVATGAVGVLLLVFDSPSAEGVQVAPSIGNQSGGVVVGGVF